MKKENKMKPVNHHKLWSTEERQSVVNLHTQERVTWPGGNKATWVMGNTAAEKDFYQRMGIVYGRKPTAIDHLMFWVYVQPPSLKRSANGSKELTIGLIGGFRAGVYDMDYVLEYIGRNIREKLVFKNYLVKDRYSDPKYILGVVKGYLREIPKDRQPRVRKELQPLKDCLTAFILDSIPIR